MPRHFWCVCFERFVLGISRCTHAAVEFIVHWKTYDHSKIWKRSRITAILFKPWKKYGFTPLQRISVNFFRFFFYLSVFSFKEIVLAVFHLSRSYVQHYFSIIATQSKRFLFIIHFAKTFIIIHLQPISLLHPFHPLISLSKIHLFFEILNSRFDSRLLSPSHYLNS